MITYSIMGFKSGFPILKEMVEKHYTAVDHRAKNSPVKVVEATYELLEEQDMHFFVVGMDEDELATYASVFILESPHHGDIEAKVDSCYTSPDYRGKGHGIELLKEVEKEAKNRDAVRLEVTFKASNNIHNLVKELELESHEVIYSKEIG